MMRKFRKMLRDNAGFTLVELIVVIAVLGILAGIAIPRLTGVQDKAEDSAAITALRSIKSYANMYFSEYGNTTTPALSTIVSEYSDQTVSDIIPDGWSITSTDSAIGSTDTITLENDNDSDKIVELDLNTGDITK